MGVHRAVEMVLDVVNSQDGPIYTFGPLIHNPQVLNILREKGVTVIDDPSDLPPGKVVVRAHGVPPEAKKKLQEAGFTIIDATCPRVIKVQAIIAKYAKQGYASVIVGDADHPEVIALMGYARGNGYVVGDAEDVEQLPVFKKVIVVAQTTQDEKRFASVAATIQQHSPGAKVFNTICDSTHKRQTEVRELAKSVDAVLVVGGSESGNTRRLVEVAAQEGVPSYHVESEKEVITKNLDSVRTLGLTAGASTPNWVIKKVYRTLEALPHDKSKGLKRYAFKLQRWLLLSNVYLALGAGCLSYSCALLSGIQPNLPSAMMAACYVLSMHILNNFIGREAVRYNDPERAHFYENHRVFLLTLAVISGGTGLFMAFMLGTIPFVVLVMISVLGLLYGVKLIPGSMKIGNRVQRISDIPGSKTILIAVAWGVVCVGLPHLANTMRISATMVFVALVASILVFVRTAFFDILDMQGDRIVAQESLPLVLGEQRSLRLLKQLLGFVFATLLFLPVMALTTALAYGLVLPILYMAFIVQGFERHWMVPGFRFELIVESVFPVTALVSFFWQVAF